MYKPLLQYDYWFSVVVVSSSSLYQHMKGWRNVNLQGFTGAVVFVVVVVLVVVWRG